MSTSRKKFIVLSALSLSVIATVASATTYVSDGKSFASVTNSNSDRTSNNTFEAFTRNMVLHRQANDNNQSNEMTGKSPDVAKADTWLMLLISGVLIGLQLRRKQKSLPNQQLLSMNAES